MIGKNAPRRRKPKKADELPEGHYGVVGWREFFVNRKEILAKCVKRHPELAPWRHEELAPPCHLSSTPAASSAVAVFCRRPLRRFARKR